MNKSRIKEILLAFRPGEGLEEDPEVRAALEKSLADPDLQNWRGVERAFDKAFAEKLDEIPVPENLADQILEAAANRPEPVRTASSPQLESSKITRWLHPAIFAAAAAIVLFLALSFTFWNPPQQPGVEGYASLVGAARKLQESVDPTFRSNNETALVKYIRERGAQAPQELPARFSWKQSFGCQVFAVEGSSVSVVCFDTEKHGKMHLYTFEKAAFPNTKVPREPVLGGDEASRSWASWSSGKNYHVLLSDGSPENLRSALDI